MNAMVAPRVRGILRLSASLVAVAALTIPTSTAFAWTWNPYNPSYNTSQDNCGWCVVASALWTVKYIPGTTPPSQTSLDSYISTKDKYPHADGSCVQNNVTYWGHDPRGWAWGLFQYTPAGYYFNDYRDSSQYLMNEEFVLGLRADSHPVGAIVQGGAHAVDLIGFSTAYDPWSYHQITINGFYVLDPWFPRSGGFSPDYYLTISSWNSTQFTPDHLDGGVGSYYYNYYNGVLRKYAATVPADNPSETYGDYEYGIHVGAPSPSQVIESPNQSGPTVAAAIQAGLAQSGIDVGRLGINLSGYSIGPSVDVRSLAPGIPDYRLVELQVRHQPRALVLLPRAATGFAFGGLTGISRDPSFMTAGGRLQALRAHGMGGSGDVVWAPSRIGAPPFAPFIRGVDMTSGQAAFVTLNGRVESLGLSS